MTKKIWPKTPIETIQAFERRRENRGSVGALIMWATLGVESLHYLNELDQAHHDNYQDNLTYPPDVRDIAHVHWATTTAVSSLDLCAAALGREYCSWTKNRELDLRDFDETRNSKPITKRRAMLPPSTLNWLDEVLSDSRYKEIHEARNSLTHSRLIRHFFIDDFPKFQISVTGSRLTVRDLVIVAKDLATDQIIAFLEVIETL